MIEANNTASGGECAALKISRTTPGLQRNMHLLSSPPDPAMVEACQNAWETRWQRGASSLPGSGRDWGPAHADGGGQHHQSQRLLRRSKTCDRKMPLPLTGLHFGRRTCGSKPAPSLALARICLRQATSLPAGLCKRGRAQPVSMTGRKARQPAAAAAQPLQPPPLAEWRDIRRALRRKGV